MAHTMVQSTTQPSQMILQNVDNFLFQHHIRQSFSFGTMPAIKSDLSTILLYLKSTQETRINRGQQLVSKQNSLYNRTQF